MITRSLEYLDGKKTTGSNDTYVKLLKVIKAVLLNIFNAIYKTGLNQHLCIYCVVFIERST